MAYATGSPELKATGTVSCGFPTPRSPEIKGLKIAGTYRNDCPTIGADMFFILIVGVLAWGAYQFFKFNTNSGAETMRAYLYLDALLQGESKETAQSLVSGNLIDLDTEVMRHIVNEIRIVHGGKRLPLVAEAYRQGMVSKMPEWYQWSTSLCDPTLSVSAVYTIPLSMREKEPHWVRSFTVYFVLNKLMAEPQGTLPGSVLLPDELVNLMDGKVSDNFKLSLAAAQKLYMAFAYPDVSEYRADFLLNEIRQYLKSTMRHIVKPGVIRQIVRKKQGSPTGICMTERELDEFMLEFEVRQAQGSAIVHLVYGMSMMSLTEDEFQSRHGKSYGQFEAEIIAFDRGEITNTDSNAIILSRQIDAMEQDMFNPKLVGQIVTFDEFYSIFVAEIKRLGSMPEDKVHPVEMMEDEPFKQAFFDGVPPKELAQRIHARYQSLA